MRQAPFHKASAAAARPDEPVTAPAAPAAAKPGFDLGRVVRRALLGRYRFAGWLGVWGAVIGTIVGWYSSAPVYRSEGLVRIASSLPQVMEETDQTRPMAMFDAYLQSQQMLLSSRELLELALQDGAWKILGRKASANDVQMLGDNLKVEFKPRTDYLRIFYTDRDPEVAAAAVRALINSYETVYSAQQADLTRQRVRALAERRATLATRLESMEAEINSYVKELGTADLAPLQANAMQRSMKLETSLVEVRRSLAGLPPARTPNDAPPGEKGSDPAPDTEISPEQLALTDSVLRNYLEAQAKREDDLIRLRSAFLENHPQLLSARQAAERGRKRIDEYVRLSRALRNSQPVAAGRGAILSPAKTADALRADEASLMTQLASLKKEMATLGAQRFRMDRLLTEEETVRKELAEVTRRIGVVDSEEAVGGRLSVISRGDVPLAPLLNPHGRGAVIGAVAGFICPGAILVICSLTRPKYRNCLQALADLAGATPVFATLPKLKERRTGSEIARAAARSVHQTCIKLAGAVRERRTSVYLVTSAGAGEGKTNVALALGTSFATAGFRTLVIDGDLDGRGITRGLGLDDLPGLHEAIESGSLRGHARGARDGLWILPTGRKAPRNYAISPGLVERLLGEARCHFELILIDTGGVFGSVDATVLAPLTDGVIFVVARGQREALVQQSVQQLDSLGTKLAGVVFNGAQRTDFERAVQTDASENVFDGAGHSESPAADPCIVTGFGPLLDAVVSSLPPKQINKFRVLYQKAGTPPDVSRVDIPQAA